MIILSDDYIQCYWKNSLLVWKVACDPQVLCHRFQSSAIWSTQGTSQMIRNTALIPVPSVYLLVSTFQGEVPTANKTQGDTRSKNQYSHSHPLRTVQDYKGKKMSDVSFYMYKNEVNLHLSIFITKFSCHPPGYPWHSYIPHHDINLNGFTSNNLRNINKMNFTSDNLPWARYLKKYICQSLSLACATPSPYIAPSNVSAFTYLIPFSSCLISIFSKARVAFFR